ncbi:MAG: leucyl aminopeptidase [Alphaproteobacteria bacterium]|nr:leucyl aminopeptidase [Alphaproteobacteria bacterium]
MSISVSFQKEHKTQPSMIVVLAYEGDEGVSLQPVSGLEASLVSLAKRALEANVQFKGRLGDFISVVTPEGSVAARLGVLGLGKAEALSALRAEEAGGKFYAALSSLGVAGVSLYVGDKLPQPDLTLDMLAASLANGAVLRGYKFERYKAPPKEMLPELKTLEVVCTHPANAKKAYEKLSCVSQGVFQARDLVNMPPNDLYPDAYAKIIKDTLKPLGVEVEIFDEKKLQKMGAGAMLAVGQGSDRPARMVVMRWNGANKKSKDAPLAFVGKGVTFDTGGISLKPGANMDEMKMDMGGSAAVVGLFKALALRKARVDVVGVVGLVENMPSSKAYRPGDIIKAYNGKTIEVLNTDAEGRLVLADCLSYVQKTYAPRFVINLATLTGAIIVALGHEYCGTFVNDETLWKQMEKVSGSSGEKLWRMPLDEVWKKEVESEVADLRNIGKSGRDAGSCTAAGFLAHFIEEGTIWSHMDIAGTAWRTSDKPTVPKYGSGFGVRILDCLVRDYYES